MLVSPYQRGLELLGNSAVLIPIRQGTKIPALRRWQCLTLSESHQTPHVALLEAAPAIAALLGPPSGNLVVIDLDTENAMAQFLSLNSALVGTLRTHGQRGCAVWVVMEGAYPACCKELLDATGEHVGEWRAGGGCYSLVAGEHPNGEQYTAPVEAPPLRNRFENLRWPGGWQGCPTAAESYEATSSKVDAYPQSSYASTSQSEASLKTVERKNEQCARLYERFVDSVWVPRPAQRNEFIRKAIPFLFQAMVEDAVISLTMRYYDQSDHLWTASRETHEYSARRQLRACASRYVQNLSKRERAIYEQLRTEPRRSAFRLFRHLSRHRSLREDCEGSNFFIKYDDLSDQLLIRPMAAWKLAGSFAKKGIISMVRNGRVRMPGVRGRATCWRYCLHDSEISPK